MKHDESVIKRVRELKEYGLPENLIRERTGLPSGSISYILGKTKKKEGKK